MTDPTTNVTTATICGTITGLTSGEPAAPRVYLGDELRGIVAGYNAGVVKASYEKIKKIITNCAHVGIDFLSMYKEGRQLSLQHTGIHDCVSDRAMDLIVAKLIEEKINVTPSEIKDGMRFDLTF